MAARDWWRSNVPQDSAGRRFLVASLIDNLGGGVRDTIFALFLVLIARLPAAEVGLALLIAGIVGILSAPFAGRMSDRLGPKTALTIGCTVNALVTCGLILIQSLWVLGALMAVSKMASQFSRIGRFTLIANVGGERRNTLRAQINVFANVGVGIGMGLGTTVLVIGTREAYLAGFVLDALTFLIAAAIQRTVRVETILATGAATSPIATSPWRAALRDHRFASVAGLNGILSFHQEVLVLGIPLWIASEAKVPKTTVSALFLLNLLIVIAFQVRFAAPIRGVAAAAYSWRKAALGIAAACGLVLVATQLGSPVARVLLVVGGGVLLTLGELWYSAAEMEISTVLAPVEQRGLYQGIFGLGRDGARTVGPLLAAVLCVSLGAWGWVILIVTYGLFSIVGPLVVRWAGRRPATPISDQIVEVA